MDQFSLVTKFPARRSPGAGLVNTPLPNFTQANDPGRKDQAELNKIRTLIQNAKKSTGIIFTTANGSTTGNITFPEQPKMLLGFALVAPIPAGTVTVKIDNTTFINNVPAAFFNVANLTSEYYEFPRPLTPTSIVTFTITDGAAQNCPIMVVYI